MILEELREDQALLTGTEGTGEEAETTGRADERGRRYDAGAHHPEDKSGSESGGVQPPVRGSGYPIQ